jgi:hypothetical protein
MCQAVDVRRVICVRAGAPKSVTQLGIRSAVHVLTQQVCCTIECVMQCLCQVCACGHACGPGDMCLLGHRGDAQPCMPRSAVHYF